MTFSSTFFFDEQNLESDNRNIVKAHTKEENSSKPLGKTENEESEDSSLSEDTRNHVESTRGATIVPEVSSREPPALRNRIFNPGNQFFPISPSLSVRPSTPRAARIRGLQKQPFESSDIQQTSQTVEGKTKVPSEIDLAKQLVKRTAV